MAPIHLHALCSANTQGWLTPGDDSRYGFSGLRQQLVTASAMALTVTTMIAFVHAALYIRY